MQKQEANPVRTDILDQEVLDELTNPDRVDIFEQEILYEYFGDAIERIKYIDCQRIISEFFDEIIVKERLLDRLAVKDSVKKQVESYLDATRRLAAGEDFSKELEKLRVEAWTEHRNQEGVDKAVLRVIVIGLYDEKWHNYEEYTADTFEVLFSTLRDVDPDLCRRFREFLVANEHMQKYKIQPA